MPSASLPCRAVANTSGGILSNASDGFNAGRSPAQNTFCESCYCSVSYTAAVTIGPQLSSMSAAEAQACGLSLSMTLVQLGALDLTSAAALSEQCSGAIQRVVGSDVCSKFLPAPATNKSQPAAQGTGPFPSNTTKSQVASKQKDPALVSARNSTEVPAPEHSTAAWTVGDSAAAGAPSTANRPQTAAQSTALALSNTTVAQVAASQGAAPQPAAATQPTATQHVSSPTAAVPGIANKSHIMLQGASSPPGNTTAAQPITSQGNATQAAQQSTVSAVTKPTASEQIGSPATGTPSTVDRLHTVTHEPGLTYSIATASDDRGSSNATSAAAQFRGPCSSKFAANSACTNTYRH